MKSKLTDCHYCEHFNFWEGKCRKNLVDQLTSRDYVFECSEFKLCELGKEMAKKKRKTVKKKKRSHKSFDRQMKIKTEKE